MRTFVSLLAAAVLAATIGWGIHTLGFYVAGVGHTFQIWTLVCWALFAAAVVLLRRVPAERVTVVVLIGAALVGGAAVSGVPDTSTDSARYAWDGIVQDAGRSPYAHAPDSHATESLRPEWLFPTPTTSASGKRECTGTREFTTHDTSTGAILCTTINRPKVFTIYPAAAELYYAAVRAVVPVTAQYWPFQVAGLLISLGMTIGLLTLLRRRGFDPRWAALWAWCPLMASEAITNSHIDLVAAALALLATALASAPLAKPGRRILAGIALGASIATKLFPVITAPALLRRQPVRVIVASIVTFVVLYVPYVIVEGPKVLGYLPGYLLEEGVDDGSGFALLFLFVQGRATTVLAVLILLVVAVIVWRTANASNPWLGQLVMVGAFLLVLSPRYPWYALLLIPFVAMTGRWEWLSIALAISIRQFWPFAFVRAETLGVALALIVFMSIYRSGPGWGRRIQVRTAQEWHRVRHPRASRRDEAGALPRD